MDSPRAVFKCTELGCENDALRLSEGIKCREHLVDRAGQCEKAARKVQEACAMVAEKTGEDRSQWNERPQIGCWVVADRIRALDIKKLLEGE